MKGKYKSRELIIELKNHLHVITDSQLAEKLGITKQTLGKLNNGNLPITAYYVLRIHEVTGWPIAYIRHVMGDESEMPFAPPKGSKGDWYWDDGMPTPRKPSVPMRGEAMALMRKHFGE